MQLKWFYLLLCSIVLRTVSLSLLALHALVSDRNHMYGFIFTLTCTFVNNQCILQVVSDCVNNWYTNSTINSINQWEINA